MKTKPILRWPGSKDRLLKHLLPLVPEHVCYCEPFAGGLALLRAKDRSPVEVINDINGNLVALYRNLQYHMPELLREIDFLFAARQNLHDFMDQPGLTEIQRAARFLLKNRTSFGGNMESFGVSKTKGGGVGFGRAKNTELLGGMHERLDKVVIENIPYERCLKNYDSAETFFFIDPPYLNSSVKAYKGWTEADLEAFRGNLDRLQGKWVVTLDDSQFNRQLFKDCRLTSVVHANKSVNRRTHGSQMFGELIITPK